MAANEFVVRLHAPQSQLTSQIQFNQGSLIGSDDSGRNPDIPVLRPRSSHEVRSPGSISSLFVEPSKRSKDDIHLAPSPLKSQRPNVPHRGLSLQMPPRDVSSTSTANLTRPVPLSPKLDPSITYATPASVLPRRSRGLDFSRSCTNLHHSTLAEQSSPDSSPIIGSRGGMMIPRKNLLSTSNIASSPGSPGSVPNSLWSTVAGAEKSAISSSVGSASMMDYESGSSSSDGDDLMCHLEEEETTTMSLQAHHTGHETMNQFESALGLGVDSTDPFSPAAAKLMSFQRALFNKKERSKKCSRTRGNNQMKSPRPNSPPLARSIESSLGGPFSPRVSGKHDMSSRRESLSLGTKDLHLSDREESDDGANFSANSNEYNSSSKHAKSGVGERKNVIRRAVTRRGNMLPKSKNFARIRAALQEESTPVDTEIRREAEVIRQVRESDADGDLSLYQSQPTTTASSPSLHATVANQSDTLESNPEDLMMSSEYSTSRRSSSSTFTNHAMRNSGGLGFWNSFDERMRTPPPILIPRGGSSGMSEDVNMDTPISTTPQQSQIRAQQSINSPFSTPQPLTATTDSNRKGNKRMRDDDFDPNFFKRRAVSPGMSLQNSPILPQSPSQREGGWWGLQSKSSRETPTVHVIGERVSSGGSNSSANGSAGPAKRIGFQGMSDTNDGLMNMSIE